MHRTHNTHATPLDTAHTQVGVQATNRKPGQRLKTMLTFKQVLQTLNTKDDPRYFAMTHERKKTTLIARLKAKIQRTLEGMPDEVSARGLEKRVIQCLHTPPGCDED